MKIKNIKINNYGKIENKEINLENKINIIYGKNESGKSTLLNYIKNIFYGISKNKNGKNISDYEKYKPWGKEDYSGKLKYELDNGQEYEIFRDFNKKNPKVYNEEMEDISKEFNIVKKDGVQFFYDQTNVDETMFTSTVLTMQEEVKLDKQDQSILVQKLANLAGTGDDNLSYKKVIDKLNKMQIEEIGSERSQGRPINIIKDRIKNIEFVLKELHQYQKDKNINEEQKEVIMEKIREEEKELDLFKQISITMLCKQSGDEKIKIKSNYKEDKNKKIEELKLEKNKLNDEINKNNLRKNNINNYENNLENNFLNENIKINYEDNVKNKKTKNRFKENPKQKNNFKKYILIIFFILIINLLIFILNKNLIKNNLINILNFLIIPIYLIFIICHEKNKKIKIKNELKIQEEKIQEEINSENNKLNYEINLLNKQIDLLLEEKNKEENEIEKEQIELDNKIDGEIEKIKEKFKNELDVNKYFDIAEMSNINILINKKQEEINKSKLDLQTIKIAEENISNKLEDMVNLKEEYEELNEELNDLEKKNYAINLTKELITRAYENMKNNITPKFTQNLSYNISKISDGKYNKVGINDEKGLIVENEFGEYIPAELLSGGTIDQLYLSLRLSMIDDMSNEKMPIILDEAFAYYDDLRMENIIKFLSDNLQEHQVIIFTCTNREKNILDKLGLEYNWVEL